MSFVIRQISTTSDGREIVRSSVVEASRITVGRDSSNEVHLADLAVEMQHATIELDENGRLSVKALTSLGFDLDGRTTDTAEIDPSTGAELRFGGHRLTVGSDAGQVIISIKRVGLVADSTAEREEIGLFTLKSIMPGRRAMAWTFIAFVLAVFLAWPIYSYSTSHGVKKRPPGYHADTAWSTGPLSLAHKSLSQNCQACHVNKFEAVTDKACVACHKDNAHPHADPARLARSKEAPGFMGTVKARFQSAFGIPQGRCVECHTEHEGAGKMPQTAQQFCSDCHGSLKSRLTDTKLPNARDFGTEHPQFRPWLTVNPGGEKREARRTVLAANVTEDNGLKFPHAMHLASNNGIARMVRTMRAEQGWGTSLACKDCHVKTADGVRFQPVEMERNCQMCHSLAFDRIGGTFRTLRHGQPLQVAADIRAFYRSTSPPRPINLSGMSRRRPGLYLAMETANDFAAGARAWPGRAEEAVRAAFTRGGACYDCHVVTPTGDGNWHVRKVFQPMRYMRGGWFDHNAHKTETCQSCHKADTSRSATDLLIPDQDSCRDCHVGGSGASLRSVDEPVNSSCAMCHDYHSGAGAPWATRPENQRAKGRPRFPQTTLLIR